MRFTTLGVLQQKFAGKHFKIGQHSNGIAREICRLHHAHSGENPERPSLRICKRGHGGCEFVAAPLGGRVVSFFGSLERRAIFFAQGKQSGMHPT
jgi:hypothetical protein